MTELRKRMIECLQLRGLSARTQESYVRAVRQLSEHYNKSPDLITEEELRQYFLFIKNVKHYSRNTRHLRRPLLLQGHAQPELDHLRHRAARAREEAARHPQCCRGTPDSQPHQIATLSSLSGNHLLRWPAFAGGH